MSYIRKAVYGSETFKQENVYTIEEFNVDSKAEGHQLNLAHVARNKK